MDHFLQIHSSTKPLQSETRFIANCPCLSVSFGWIVFRLTAWVFFIARDASKFLAPPKTNMEPENTPLEEEKHLRNHQILGSVLIFRGVSPLSFTIFRHFSMSFNAFTLQGFPKICSQLSQKKHLGYRPELFLATYFECWSEKKNFTWIRWIRWYHHWGVFPVYMIHKNAGKLK